MRELLPVVDAELLLDLSPADVAERFFRAGSFFECVPHPVSTRDKCERRCQFVVSAGSDTQTGLEGPVCHQSAVRLDTFRIELIADLDAIQVTPTFAARNYP